MTRVSGTVRRIVLHAVATACAASLAGAQERAPTLAQLAHRAWTAQNGAPAGTVALAQTSDGFLWLGGLTGLYRFDGIQFERYDAPTGQELPALTISALSALPDGSLWVGYSFGGVSVITAGRVVSYGLHEGLPNAAVNSIVRDSAGTMWMGSTRGLARLVGARWETMGPAQGYPGGFVADLAMDRRGTLWVTATAGVFVRPRGSERFTRWSAPLSVGESEIGSGAVREAPDGSVWAVSISRGLIPMADSAGHALPERSNYRRDRGSPQGWWNMLVDSHSHAWGYNIDRLVRVTLPPNGTPATNDVVWDTLAFTPQSGMSGHNIMAAIEDREGTIWLATELGLDQFRVAKVTAIPWPERLMSPTVAPANNGGVWAGSTFAPVSLIGDHRTVRRTPRDATTMTRDLSGDLWIGGVSGLWREQNERFTRLPLPPELEGAVLVSIARAQDGTLWVSGQRRGVFRRQGSTWERYGAVDSYAQSIAADSAGRTWLGYLDGRLVCDSAGTTRTYGPSDGLRVGGILTIVVQERRVWVGGQLGVAVADGEAARNSHGRHATSRFTSLVTTDGPLRGVGGIVTTRDAVWFRGPEGVAHIAHEEIAAALRDSTYRARAERLDVRDRIDGTVYLENPTAIKGSDERLWFTWIGGLGWVDPIRMRRNPVPPLVVVRGVAVGGNRYAVTPVVTLPRRTTALSIAYTASSLAIPERVRFRYRLIGLDTTWQDVGARREAFYTNLQPRTYRFEVSAANEDGVWSARAATIGIEIPPTFVQTSGFLAFGATCGVVALWLLVAWRQRRVARAERARADAVLAERMRVARELHDTLLSDMAGMAMRLEAAAQHAARDPQLASAVLPELRDQARRTLEDTRNAVTAMRATAGDVVPLPAQLADAARRVFQDTSVRVDARTTGTPRRLAPIVEGETLRIATEALVNARKHADCRTIVLTCTYEGDSLSVVVQDDGRGFDAALDGADGVRLGHWGVIGMRERATGIGGTLTLTTTRGHGTVVRLQVPLGDVMLAPA